MRRTAVVAMAWIGVVLLVTAMWGQKLNIPQSIRTTGTIAAVNPGNSSLLINSSNGQWRVKLKNSGSAGTLRPGAPIEILQERMLEFSSRGIVGPLSWACTGDWRECSCNKGSDCDSICATVPKCNPKIPDECTCRGDAKKGGE